MALPLWQLHWRCLQSLATAAESRTVLLRSGCIGAAPSLAHRLLLGAKERDEPRAAAVLDFLANLAFDRDGQAAVRAEHHLPTEVSRLEKIFREFVQP